MTLWIAAVAVLLILLTGLVAMAWDWIDDRRLEIGMLALCLAVVVSCIWA